MTAAGRETARIAVRKTVASYKHMAPGQRWSELHRDGRDIDAATDVFALGCVRFECVAGRATFDGARTRCGLVLRGIARAGHPRGAQIAL